jgi:hypothetical protein
MGEWKHSFTLRPLYLRGKSAGIHWIGGWVGPRAGLDTKMCKKSTATVLKLKHLGTKLTNRNGVHDEIRRRVTCGHVCYYSVLKLYFPKQ